MKDQAKNKNDNATIESKLRGTRMDNDISIDGDMLRRLVLQMYGDQFRMNRLLEAVLATINQSGDSGKLTENYEKIFLREKVNMKSLLEDQYSNLKQINCPKPIAKSKEKEIKAMDTLFELLDCEHFKVFDHDMTLFKNSSLLRQYELSTDFVMDDQFHIDIVNGNLSNTSKIDIMAK